MEWRSLRSDERIRQGRASLPLVLECRGEGGGSADLGRAVAEDLRGRLARAGALLVRGAGVADAQDFEEFLGGLGLSLEEHYVIGLTPRNRWGKRVFSSTEAPGAYHVLQHTEMCYQAVRPGVVAFFCETEPRRFGETPIFDTRGALEALPEPLRQRLESQRIRYRRYFHAQKTHLNYEKTWSDSFATGNRAEVEEVCRRLDTRFEWLPNGDLRTETDVPAIVRHPLTGESALGINVFHPAAFRWELREFSERHPWWRRLVMGAFIEAQFQKPQAFMRISWEDGTPLEKTDVHDLCEAMWAHATVFPWRKGDVLLLDNVVTGHARLNVEPPRRILAALGERIDVRTLETLPASAI